MDVVAHAGAVRRRIVVTEDPWGLAPGQPVEDHRHDVEHTRVGQLGRRRPGHVEVAQADRGDPVGRAGRPDQPLAGELGLAVRVHRRARGVLDDEVHIRVAVDRGRGGEHQPPDPRLGHRVQERGQTAHVLPVVPGRLGHRLGDLLARGEMDHTGHRVVREDPLEQFAVERYKRQRSSSASTRSPASLMARATCAPMYPAPPVISHVMVAHPMLRPHRRKKCAECPLWGRSLWAGPRFPDDDRGRGECEPCRSGRETGGERRVPVIR